MKKGNSFSVSVLHLAIIFELENSITSNLLPVIGMLNDTGTVSSHYLIEH